MKQYSIQVVKSILSKYHSKYSLYATASQLSNSDDKALRSDNTFDIWMAVNSGGFNQDKILNITRMFHWLMKTQEQELYFIEVCSWWSDWHTVFIHAGNGLASSQFLNRSIGQCKKDITPLLTHWSYVFLTLTHRDDNHDQRRHIAVPL